MYLQEPSYQSVVALVLGYDMASEGGVLIGFREWLITRLATGNNFAWPALVLRATFPDAVDVSAVVSANSEAQRRAIDRLFELIAEFDDVRRAPDGLRKIYADYEKWLKTQPWYVPGSPSWVG